MGIVFAKSDMQFGLKIFNDLQKLGLKCTVDQSKVSKSRYFYSHLILLLLNLFRAFVLIFSEDAAADETVLRLLTRAAGTLFFVCLALFSNLFPFVERFNDGETNIFPVVHPKCGTAVLNQIPNTLAYSLSNTSFVSFLASEALADNAEFAKDFYEVSLPPLLLSKLTFF